MNSNFEAYLAGIIKEDIVVDQAMNYALTAPGKRLRPFLLLSFLKDCGYSEEYGYPCAAAIEMIHTYSLIHDDLPAMDNDDLRRGRKTVHRQFNEATAILAGDALLTKAFEVIADSDYIDNEKVKLVSILSKCAGHQGMINGQVLDISLTYKETVEIDDLSMMEYYKTGMLLTAPLLCGAALTDNTDLEDKIIDIGKKIGLAFQIQDDVLDYTSNEETMGKSISDSRNNKNTFYNLLGLKGCTDVYIRLYNSAISVIDKLPISLTSTKKIILEMKNRRK